MRKRYNISGLFIFDQFEGEEKRQPTCIEDCTEETLEKYLKQSDAPRLRRVVRLLCNTLHSFAENVYEMSKLNNPYETENQD